MWEAGSSARRRPAGPPTTPPGAPPRARAQPSAASEAGFTAIELLVVLAGIALIGALALPWYSGAADTLRFRTAMRGVAADLRQARNAAVAGGAPVALAFDPAGHGYGVPGGRWIALPADVLLAWADGPLVRDAGRLDFFADGSATGGTLRLDGPRQAAVVSIDALTGRFTTETGQR